MKKQILAASLATLMLGAAALPAAAQNVAVVNGVPIPQSRLTALQQQIEIQAQRLGRPVPPEVKAQLKEELIAREVFAQAAKAQGLDKTPEFQSQLALARDGILANDLFEKYNKAHPITDAAAQAEYDKLVKEQTPAAGAKEYKARHILVKTEAEAKEIIKELDANPAPTKDAGTKLADGNRATSGASANDLFAKLAKEKSIDTGSGKEGGELGWASASTYVPEFGEALEKLKDGQITQEPVKTQFGYHVIQLEATRDAPKPKIPPFDQVKAQIIQQMQQQQLAKYQQELRDKAKVQ